MEIFDTRRERKKVERLTLESDARPKRKAELDFSKVSVQKAINSRVSFMDEVQAQNPSQAFLHLLSKVCLLNATYSSLKIRIN